MSGGTFHAVLLGVHVVSGSVGLGLGPLVMVMPKRRGLHTTLGQVYQWTTAGLCTTALGLVLLKPSLWGLAIIAVATEVTALGGLIVARRRRGNWLPLHLSLMCGSYLSFVTAFFVVNLGLGFWPAWILPTVIGSPLIARTARRHPTPPPNPPLAQIGERAQVVDKGSSATRNEAGSAAGARQV